MLVYAVFRQAIYRHECVGIFSSADAAGDEARAAARTDVDDHHTYAVVAFPLGEALPRGEGRVCISPPIEEAEPSYKVRRCDLV